MLNVKPVSDRSFLKYGRVVEGFDTRELLEALNGTPLPEDVVYVPGAPELERLPIFREFSERLYGGMPIQMGYCNGVNHLLNCVEYHRDSEFNFPSEDIILLLGCQQDIDLQNYTYETSRIEAFRVPKGTLFEMYATTLHYAPVSTGVGFRNVVVLPRGTNCALTFDPGRIGEARLLTHVNKWLIAHPETNEARSGAHAGLIGPNLRA